MQLANLKLHIDDDPGCSGDLAPFIKARLGKGLPNSGGALAGMSVKDVKILKRALDARSKPVIHFVYTLEFTLRAQPGAAEGLLDIIPGLVPAKADEDTTLLPGDHAMRYRPLVVGTGPAGLFCALTLARMGYKPIVIDRGDRVETRRAKVDAFWNTGILDPESNVQFGEGGAGTFSDGKLTTRIKDPRIGRVLVDFVESGAPEEILSEAKPHVGTDLLVGIVAELRERIKALGGEVLFRTKLVDLTFAEGRVTRALLRKSDGVMLELPVDVLVLALGNSSRDTFGVLRERGVVLEAKPISVGVRIEHPQDMIDGSQYGAATGHPKLGHAEYQLSLRNEVTGKAAYTFCMCPGGEVVASSSEEGGVVTNGMSRSRRDSGVSNSALVVSVDPADIPGDDPLRVIGYQRALEVKAFVAGGGDYKAPAQRVGDFLGMTGGSVSGYGGMPTYRPGVVETDLCQVLPGDICKHIREALLLFDRRLKGFADPNAWLTGVETRTSSPVRIVRGGDYQAQGIRGLYPAGEGAGYAGGIMSAAVDGIRVAESIITEWSAPLE